MRKTDWYVIQVQVGREQKACEVIRRACEDASSLAPHQGMGERMLLQECFSPAYKHRRKLKGEWIEEELQLLPGYVIAVTRNPWALSRTIYGAPEFARLVTVGKAFVPLSADDRSWIERWTTQGDRTIPISFGYKEGDKVVVIDGPLVGQEAMITRVNRRKRVAHLEIHAGQLTIHTTVGLEVLPRPDEHPCSIGKIDAKGVPQRTGKS